MRRSSTVSDDNRVIRPNTANAAYLFLVIKKKVDAANSEISLKTFKCYPWCCVHIIHVCMEHLNKLNLSINQHQRWPQTLSLACYCRPTLLARVFPAL